MNSPHGGLERDDDLRVLKEAFALLHKAPLYYQSLLFPVLIRAGNEPELRPFVRLMVSDPYFGHILSGGQPEPFLPEGLPHPAWSPVPPGYCPICKAAPGESCDAGLHS